MNDTAESKDAEMQNLATKPHTLRKLAPAEKDSTNMYLPDLPVFASLALCTSVGLRHNGDLDCHWRNWETEVLICPCVRAEGYDLLASWSIQSDLPASTTGALDVHQHWGDDGGR